MSRMVNFGKRHARLRGRIAGRGGQAVGNGVSCDDEILVRVKRLAGSDHEIKAVMIAADRRDHQDGIRLLGVECPVRNVRD